MFPVSAAKLDELTRRMAALGLREADLDERFVRSSGRGGQNVNKVATCVVLTHRPSGLSVRCQQERSQALNRFLARRLLADKLEEKLLGEQSARRKAVERLRRQKQRRRRRSKEKILQSKHHRSELKALRKRPLQE